MQVKLDLSNPHNHEIKVTISGEMPEILRFPVWTPGSYMVRDYARHILEFKGGSKIDKTSWRRDASAKSVSYSVYCFDRTVRTSFFDERYAALVGATILPLLNGPFTVEVILPKGWPLLGSQLRFRKKSPRHFVAKVRDDDHWIDSPIVAADKNFGGFTRFTIDNMPHEIFWVGEPPAISLDEMKNDFKASARATLQMFGSAPFKRYTYLLHFFHKAYGGLEHRESQLSQFDGAQLTDKDARNKFNTLIAHEYFHAWNVKAIRPEAYGPFDYLKENHSEDIWFAEGMTDYFDDWLCFKAGLIDEKTYWKARLEDIDRMPDGLAGHRRRALKEGSFDAWISLYKAEENYLNTDVSYYAKGAQLGWCWDAHLQKKSKGKWSLARLMKAIYKKFGVMAEENLCDATPGFRRDELLEFAEEKTGIKQAKLVESWVSKRGPMPWRDAAAFFDVKVEENIRHPVAHHTGISFNDGPGDLKVKMVFHDSAGAQAGISAKDELLAVNGVRIRDKKRLKAIVTRPGMKLTFLLARGGHVIERSLTTKKHAGIGVNFQVKPAGKDKKKKSKATKRK